MAASERYNTRFEDALARRLGVEFLERPTGRRDLRPVREIDGVPPDLLQHFSRRRAAIEQRYAELRRAYRAAHGREPDRSTQIQLAQQATLETREAKGVGRTLAEQVADRERGEADGVGRQNDRRAILVEQLGYAVPVLVRQRLQDLKLGPFKRMLDLGCGTGLTGGTLRDMVDDITGIDISENMVEIAHEKDLYETLYVAEVEDFLEDNDDEAFDLVTATDVLPYLGALEPLFFGAAENMVEGGIFVFSSETLPEEVFAGRSYMVGPHQRFAHAETYVRERLAATGFDLIEISEINVRMQDGNPTPGHLVIARLKG